MRGMMENANEHGWPVGPLKPNDLGLFDIEGNASQWCNDFATVYRVPWFGADRRYSRFRRRRGSKHANLAVRGGSYVGPLPRATVRQPRP